TENYPWIDWSIAGSPTGTGNTDSGSNDDVEINERADEHIQVLTRGSTQRVHTDSHSTLLSQQQATYLPFANLKLDRLLSG
ncbi:unnamed protein product, partial [Allacma fusca]